MFQITTILSEKCLAWSAGCVDVVWHSDRGVSVLKEQPAKAPEGLCVILPVSGEFSYSLITCWKDKGVCRHGVTYRYTDTFAEKILIFIFIPLSQPLCLQCVSSFLLLLMGVLALGWHQHFCHHMGGLSLLSQIEK